MPFMAKALYCHVPRRLATVPASRNTPGANLAEVKGPGVVTGGSGWLTSAVVATRFE
jgi:hypothetical protein